MAGRMGARGYVVKRKELLRLLEACLEQAEGILSRMAWPSFVRVRVPEHYRTGRHQRERVIADALKLLSLLRQCRQELDAMGRRPRGDSGSARSRVRYSGPTPSGKAEP